MPEPAIALLLDNHSSAATAVQTALAGEAAGVERVWLAEDLFHRGALPTAAAILQATNKLQVGIGVVAPQLRHPAALAMDARSLLDLAPGRITLGLGAGVAERTGHLGQPASPPLGIVRQNIAAVRGLLAGQEVTEAGILHQLDRLKLSGPPPERDLPVFAAAVGPKALAQAGRIADGVVLSMMCSAEHVRAACQIVADAAGQAGRGPVPVIGYVPVCLMDDAAEAKQSMRRTVAEIVAAWAGLDFLSRLFTEWSPLTVADMAAVADALAAGRPLESLLPDELVDSYAISGDLPECQRLLDQFGQAGLSEVALSCEDGRTSSAFDLARQRSAAA